MSANGDGGHAFPAEGGDMSGLRANPGMTMRQYYKAAALQLIDSRYTNVGNEAACAYEIARYAGLLADALLAEDRERVK